MERGAVGGPLWDMEEDQGLLMGRDSTGVGYRNN